MPIENRVFNSRCLHLAKRGPVPLTQFVTERLVMSFMVWETLRCKPSETIRTFILYSPPHSVSCHDSRFLDWWQIEKGVQWRLFSFLHRLPHERGFHTRKLKAAGRHWTNARSRSNLHWICVVELQKHLKYPIEQDISDWTGYLKKHTGGAAEI